MNVRSPIAPWLFVMLSGCGEPFEMAGSGGSAPTSTTVVGGSGGSDMGSGGQTTATPECVQGTFGACGEGRYCRAPTSTCAPCADMSRLHFAPPTALDLKPTTTGTTAHYPRTSVDDGTLHFVYVDKNGALPRSRVVSGPFTPNEGMAGPWTPMPPPVASMTEESAPLVLPNGSMLDGLVDGSAIDVGKPVLLFDSTRNGTTTRKLFAANFGAPDASVVSLPSGKKDFDLAAAPDAKPPRFFWMSNGITGLEARLVTATRESAQMTPVSLALDTGCVVDTVVAPWVHRKGAVLLFGVSPPMPGTCAPAVVGHERLYVATMDGTGQQASGDVAKPIFAEDPTSFDTTPSLSNDGCLLLFSRFDPITNQGRPMMAVRD